MENTTHQNGWDLIDWDGNPDLRLKCWRKKFGRGQVSVGVGDFLNIVYSHGANSDHSLTDSRWRKDGNISEYEAMQIVDKKQRLLLLMKSRLVVVYVAAKLLLCYLAFTG